jgi:hypothetical protein
VSLHRRVWAWWRQPAEPAPEWLPRPDVAAHEEWLADLLEELRTPEAEGAFQRTDTLTLLNDPDAAIRRLFPPNGEPRP